MTQDPVRASQHPTSLTGTSPHDSRPEARLKPLAFLGELEGLRAIAALAVMLTHIGFLSGATGRDVLPGFLARLDIGVAVFFVLSGFLLFRPHVHAILDGARHPVLRYYVARRMARLMPALFACLLGTLVLVPESRDASAQAWLANILQLQAWRSEWDLPGLAQLWSLSTEIAFYAVLPLIGLVAARVGTPSRPGRLLLWILLLAMIGLGMRAFYHVGWLPGEWFWPRTLPLMLDWFSWGMMLAVIAGLRGRISSLREALHRSGTASLVVAASLFWFLTTWAAGPYDLQTPAAWQDWVKHVGYGIVACLVVLPSALGSVTVLTKVLRSRIVTYLGRISYGFFLWHLPVIFWVRTTLGLEWFAGGFWLTVAATSLVTIVLASASWYLLERPIMDWVRRRTHADATG